MRKRSRVWGLIGAACAAAALCVAPAAISAPAKKPAAARKLPDWDGLWELTGGALFDPQHVKMAPGAAIFGPNEGSYMTDVPYKPEYQKLYDETVAKAAKGQVADPVANCMRPHGMPRELGGAPGPVQVIVTPKVTLFIWNYFNAARRIYTDGRPHPDEDHLYASSMGHSIGRWEGDTLVVDTVAMMAGDYDRSGAPHSDQVHLSERIRLVSPKVLEDQITIVDPVMLTRPWKITRRYGKYSDAFDRSFIMGQYCEGGADVTYVDGGQSIVLPGERLTPKP